MPSRPVVLVFPNSMQQWNYNRGHL